MTNDGCQGCYRYLTKQGYDFVETTFEIPPGLDGKPIPMDRRDFVNRLVAEPGIYRYTLKKKGDADCALFRERLEHAPGNYGRLPGSLGETHCIASNRIDAASARYEVEYREELVWFDDIARVLRSGYLIRDRRTGEILAEAVQYVNWRRDRRRIRKKTLRCPTEREYLTIEEILVPHRSTTSE